MGDRFVRLKVNNRLYDSGDEAPDRTLLAFLRNQCGLTGTKEGCASGDCGACTVMVHDERGEKPRSYTVNSCICPVESLRDQSVTTVEGLGGDGVHGELHPVQEAMVACDGSQCGFCTPGFVMSLAALHSETLERGMPEDPRRAVLDAISGNLCRCTGYRPIVEAGIRALNNPDFLTRNGTEPVSGAPLSGSMETPNEPCSFWQPGTEAELQRLLSANPEARLVAGGTDLMLEHTQLFRRLPKLIDLNRIESLRRIELGPEHIDIGAAVTYTEMETAFADIAPELVRMLERLGSRQIRNRGTIGGNIGNASPIADMPPFLLVMDAELVIRDARGNSRSEPLCEFYQDYKQTTLQPGEYIALVRIDRPRPGQWLRLHKLSKRYEDDITTVMGAFLWDAETGLRVAYGGMAAVPARAWRCEQVINYGGTAIPTLDDLTIERACAELNETFSPIGDVRASADYRRVMAASLFGRACRGLKSFASGEEPEEELHHHG